MNKPIRTISLFCLVLFLALMLNATYLSTSARASSPRTRRTAASSTRRSPASAARSSSARTRSREACPVDDAYDFQRVYPQPFKYAPLTGFFSYYSQTGIERSQNDVLSGDDSRLFVTRLVDMLSNTDPKGGNVQLTIDPEAQTAAYEGLRALGEDVQGAVVAIEPATGKILAMVSNPTYDPNKLASHDFGAVTDDLRGARAGPGRAAASTAASAPRCPRGRPSSW